MSEVQYQAGMIVGDLEILERLPRSRFRVKYTCCGHERMITLQGMNRRKAKQSACRGCKKKSWRYVVGDVVANCLILDCHHGKGASGQKYTIRLMCCGTTKVISHRALVQRQYYNTQLCRRCQIKEVNEAPKKVLWVSFSHGPKWDKPSWIPIGQAPTVGLR